MKGTWTGGAHSASWGWTDLKLRWSSNWALSGEESGDAVAQGSPQSLQKQQKVVFGMLVGEQRKCRFQQDAVDCLLRMEIPYVDMTSVYKAFLHTLPPSLPHRDEMNIY